MARISGRSDKPIPIHRARLGEVSDGRSVSSQSELREQLAKDVEEFLRKGGHIEELPPEARANSESDMDDGSPVHH